MTGMKDGPKHKERILQINKTCFNGAVQNIRTAPLKLLVEGIVAMPKEK